MPGKKRDLYCVEWIGNVSPIKAVRCVSAEWAKRVGELSLSLVSEHEATILSLWEGLAAQRSRNGVFECSQLEGFGMTALRVVGGSCRLLASSRICCGEQSGSDRKRQHVAFDPRSLHRALTFHLRGGTRRSKWQAHC